MWCYGMNNNKTNPYGLKDCAACRVELPSAFPFIVTVHKTIDNKDALSRINVLNRSYN
uniref:Uncharacterized protein n=2 Tax=Cyprinus carpio TaxID=7962 RepID=A0A8C1A292_CYPCA